MTHHFVALLHHRRREAPAVQAQADALLTLATAQGFPLYVGHGTCWRGWTLAVQGQPEAGTAQLHQGLNAVLATGQTMTRPFHLVLLAEIAGHAGQVEVGLHLLAEALTAFETSGRADMLAEVVSAPGRIPAATNGRRPDPRGSLFSTGPGHCASPTGQVVGAACGHEPRPAVATAREARRSPPAPRRGLYVVHRGV